LPLHSMSSLRDKLIIKVVHLKDFLSHVDRADRIYFIQRGDHLIALASNFLRVLSQVEHPTACAG